MMAKFYSIAIWISFLVALSAHSSLALESIKTGAAPIQVKPPVKRMLQPPATDGKQPDLVFSKDISVRHVSSHLNDTCEEFCKLLAGETYIFTAVIKNNGSKESRPCRMMFKLFYKSEPSNISGFNSKSGRIFHFDVPALYPGTEAEIPLQFKLENTGLFYLYALADSKRQIAESNEENNLTALGQQLAFSSQAKWIDYEVDAHYEAPKEFGYPTVLAPMKIHVTVTNRGTIPALGGTLEVVFHNSRAGTKRFSLGKLDPGQSYSKTLSHRYRGVGTKKITVKMIPARGVTETRGANNQKKLKFKVR
jgi:hypothetical protein